MVVKTFRNGVAPYLLSAVVIVALMLTLIQVLQGAVQRGAIANAAYAERTESPWRCNAKSGTSERNGCIALQVGSTSAIGAPLMASAGVRSH